MNVTCNTIGRHKAVDGIYLCHVIATILLFLQIAGLNQQITQLKSTGEEVLAKLRSKEEMAAAATAARTAAERSLQMADERAAELRERLEELNKQLEDADRIREYRGPIGMGLFDMCWPRLRNLGRPSGPGGTQLAAEMEELLEPLV